MQSPLDPSQSRARAKDLRRRGAWRTTPGELALVRTFATGEQIAGWKKFGAYIGYRLGIRADGT